MTIRFTIKKKTIAFDTELLLIWGVFIFAVLFVTWTYIRSLDYKKGPQSARKTVATQTPSITPKPSQPISITPKVTAKVEPANTSVTQKLTTTNNTTISHPSNTPIPTQNAPTNTPTPLNGLKALISPVIHSNK